MRSIDNEDVELIIPVYDGEQFALASWLVSLAITCRANQLFITVVDVGGLRQKYPWLEAFDDQVSWLDGAAHVNDLPALLKMAVGTVREQRPGSCFTAFSHADVVGVRDGWLDMTLERLIRPEIGLVAFTPGRIFADHDGNTFDMPDDWFMIMRSEDIDAIGFSAGGIRSFNFVTWLTKKLQARGMAPILLKAAEQFPIIVHAKRRALLGKGRHSDGAEREREHSALRHETASL